MVWRRINKCFAISERERENEWKQTSTSACSFKWLFSRHPSAGTMCCPPEYHQGTKENSIKHFYTLIDLDCYRYLQQHVGEPSWWMDKGIQQKDVPKTSKSRGARWMQDSKRGEGPAGSVWPLLRVSTEVKSPEVPTSAGLSDEPSSSYPEKVFQGKQLLIYYFFLRSPFLIVLHLLKPCFGVSGVGTSWWSEREGFFPCARSAEHTGERRVTKWCIEVCRGVKDCSCRTKCF